MTRLLLAGVLLAAALLTVLPAPAFPFWVVELAVTEAGYWLAPAAVLFLIGMRRGGRPARVAAGLAMAAALLLVLPAIRALWLARSVPAAMDAAFGPERGPSARPASRPFDPGRLFDWRRPSAIPVATETVLVPSTSAEPLRMDLYRPIADAASSAMRPAVLIVHGGSWQRGSRTDFADASQYLAGRGIVVASVDYRLAPQWRFPAAADDVRAAVAYLRAQARGLGVDPHRIVILGRSAGGQIALLVGYTDGGLRGVIALYAPTDLEYAYAHPTNPLVLDSRATLEAYLGGPPDERRMLYQAASPLHHVAVSTPPTLLVHGARDELVFAEHSRRLAERLAQNGRPHLHLALPWATHACDVHLNGPCGRLTLYAIERFIRQVTAATIDDR